MLFLNYEIQFLKNIKTRPVQHGFISLIKINYVSSSHMYLILMNMAEEKLPWEIDQAYSVHIRFKQKNCN